MLDFSQKYRPQRFDDVVGQEEVIARLKTEVRTGPVRPILLSGPYGTGKTSLGLIFARAFLCQSPIEGEACGRCEPCTAHSAKRNFDLQCIACGERSTIDDIKQALAAANTAPLFSKRRVLVLDEVSNLSHRAFDALLNVTENPPRWAALILLTNKPEAIPHALLSRLTHLETKLLGVEDAVEHLAHICSNEQISYDREALVLIHAELKGHVRSMVRTLQECSSFGRVDASSVKSALNLNVFGQLGVFADALSRGDLQSQIDLIQNWDETASRKLNLIHRFFVDCYLVEVRRIRSGDRLMQGAGAGVRASLINMMSVRAMEFDTEVDPLWQALLAKYEPRDALTDYQLRMVIATANDVLQGPTVMPRQKRKKAQSKFQVSRDENCGQHGYLSWRQLRPQWLAASYLMQQYGQTFNVRTTIEHEGAGEECHVAGARLVSQFTHQLGMRLGEWMGEADASGRQFHWGYRHEADELGRLVTRVALSMPAAYIPKAKKWAAKFFQLRLQTREIRDYRFTFRSEETSALRFHWQSIRAFSRSLDPSLLARSGDGDLQPLVALLNVPKRLRAPAAAGVKCAQACGSSATLGPGAQRAATRNFVEFLCPIRDRAWASIDGGWELEEYFDRLQEIERRNQLEAEVRARFGEDGVFSAARREHELDALRASFCSDPHRMLRGWKGWWQSGLQYGAISRSFGAQKKKTK